MSEPNARAIDALIVIAIVLVVIAGWVILDSDAAREALCR